MQQGFVLLEEVHGDILADSDVDELLGRINGANNGGQIVGSTAGTEGFW